MTYEPGIALVFLCTRCKGYQLVTISIKVYACIPVPAIMIFKYASVKCQFYPFILCFPNV